MKSDKNSSPPRSSEPVTFMKSDKPGSPRVAEAAPVATNGGVPEAEAAGVDKIRNLLFGNQMQDYDRRFSVLEERFLQRFRELEEETSRNLGAFESNAKKQVDSLATQLREGKDQRADADREIERLVREQNQALEKRIRVLSDQLSQFDRDMADRLTHETQSLREELKQRHADMRQPVENMFAELSNVKTDRSLLATLFVEVAKCLNQDIGSKAKGPAESLRSSSTQLT